MLTPCSSDAFGDQVLQIPLSDRWLIYHRLQELMIPCSYCPDSCLPVQINTLLAGILIRSTVIQFLASRHELVDWLKHYWYYSPE